MIRFIHAADIHLDSPMLGIDSDNARIDPNIYRMSTRIALSNLIDFAIREKVDFISLGGDNYDGNWDSYQTGLYFLEQISRLGDIPVVSITGNHDAANKMTLNLTFPKNFKQLSVDNPEVYEIIKGVRIVGQGFKDQQEKSNIVASYPRLDGSGIKIGLLHTSLDGKPGHANYAPCTIDDLRAKQYHFWGLGHIHKHSWETGEGDLPILFPGNIQGRHIRETGEKGAWLITLDDNGVLINKHFEALDVTRWENIVLDISDLNNCDDLWQRCGVEMTRQKQKAGNRSLAIRVQITGASQIHYDLLNRRKGEEDGILSEIQRVASSAAPQKIWVEKVVLRSGPPLVDFNVGPAMKYLEDFIKDTVSSEPWIHEFLKTDEISKLKNQIYNFKDFEEQAGLESIFNADSIRSIIQEIPAELKSHLIKSRVSQDDKSLIED